MIRLNSTYNSLADAEKQVKISENEAVKQALDDMMTRAEESFRLGTAQGNAAGIVFRNVAVDLMEYL